MALYTTHVKHLHQCSRLDIQEK